MATLGIEICDAGFQSAVAEDNEPRLTAPAGPNGVLLWPGFAFQDGARLFFGREAEDSWFVHPRRVTHAFWEKLSHEPTPLHGTGKAPSCSELSFHFLRDYLQRLGPAASSERVVLAVPSAYLKDSAVEDEKVGLILGMANELKLPLVGVVDEACAALCDARGAGINPAHPVIVVDAQLHGATLALLSASSGLLQRKDYVHLPQAGFAHLLKHLTASMGNRFLRHTAFDILEDGRIEQTFYRQTKEFFVTGAAEHRYQINTARRTYEFIATREQLASDTQGAETALLHGLQGLVAKSGLSAGGCTVALTARVTCLPGFAARLQGAGFVRVVKLPAGAAAAGAAALGSKRARVANLADVQVDSGVDLTEVKQSSGATWEALLHKARLTEPRVLPSHVVIDGIGHVLGGNGTVTIGAPGLGPVIALPAGFTTVEDCLVKLERSGGRLWFSEGGSQPARVAVEAGDRLVIRCGAATADLLFASVRSSSFV